ncbi:MAG: hypothetical protein ACI9KE_003157 [Polyangiales bacterium]|jgi:hypothetical protein
MSNPIIPASFRPDISLVTTAPRITPPSTGQRFRDALGEGAMGVLDGVEQAAGLVPGGGAVAAAIRAGQRAQGAAGNAGISGAGTAPTASGPESVLAGSQAQAMELLEMQQQISMEQRQFQTVSNVMKARHDTAKAVIQNVR